MRNKAIHIFLFLLFLSLMGYAAAVCPQSAEAADTADARITDINIMDDAVEISISGDFTYTAYKPTDPFTVAVDLPGVDKGDYAGKLSSDKTGISEIMISGTQTPSPTARLEIFMERPAEIEAVKTDGSLIIRLKEDEASSMAPAMTAQAEEASPGKATPAMEAMMQRLSPASRITDVAFDYSDGTLKLVIQGDGAMNADVYSLGDRIVVDVLGVTMAASMPAAVVSPVTSVRYGPHNGAIRLVIGLKRSVEFDASTVGDKVIIALPADEVLEIMSAEKEPAEEMEKAPAAAAAEPTEEGEAQKYTGKIISLDFQNADIIPIFRFIGDISGYNVVIHPSVKGTVTLKLMNVPWDQALDIVLDLYGLGTEIEGNIMTIAPTSVFDKIAKEQAQHKQTQEVTAELLLRTIHLVHIDVKDMQKEINSRKVLSPRGNLTIDETANDLWVEDTADSLNKVNMLVKHFDRAMYGRQQIMVEARLVIVSTTSNTVLGIDWGMSYGAEIMGVPVTGNFAVNPPRGTATANFPTALAGSAITGTSPYANINLTISALETVGDAKTLANPRVLTINNQEARIQSGTQIPVQTTTAEGSTTQFVNANLQLKVTPSIKPNDIIELEVSVNKDEPTTVGGATGIDANSIQTTALVQNGETLVLGGIYQSDVETAELGIPGLRKIPILGWLFKNKSEISNTTELLILITPRIIKD